MLKLRRSFFLGLGDSKRRSRYAFLPRKNSAISVFSEGREEGREVDDGDNGKDEEVEMTWRKHVEGMTKMGEGYIEGKDEGRSDVKMQEGEDEEKNEARCGGMRWRKEDVKMMQGGEDGWRQE